MARREFGRAAALGLAGAAVAPGRVRGAASAESFLRIRVLGESSCIPDVGRETACLLINDKHLVDTGWCTVARLRDAGIDPVTLETLIFTHLHHDHYIGLPQVLFYLGMRKRPGPPLRIIGPGEHLARVLGAADAFLQVARFPEIAAPRDLVPLRAGDRFETSDLRFETFAARHVSGRDRAEPALVYRVSPKTGGACAAFTGDTHHHPPIAGFVRGVSLLIHDGSHTQPADAARIAREAGVGRLVLIHYPEARAARMLAEARAIFPNTDLAEAGHTLEVHR